ncbi:hypothetical protein NL676_008678 [Syzygium grande]|nr:hypothetical protein NL676_008678 [Syzygium grande]
MFVFRVKRRLEFSASFHSPINDGQVNIVGAFQIRFVRPPINTALLYATASPTLPHGHTPPVPASPCSGSDLDIRS